ncbi:MAG: PorV/PorQ family protein [bacterium]
MILRAGYISLAVLLLLCSPLGAVEGNGGYAGAFFQIPIGARPTGMGGAYLAVSDDGAGTLFNPAGLANLQRKLFSTSYRFLGLDRTLGYATVVFPSRGQSAIGLNWLYAGSGEVTARDRNGRDLGRTLSEHNHSFGLIFAKRFEKYLSTGIHAKYLHSVFAEMTAFSLSFDFGLMVHVNQFFDRETRDLMAVQDMRIGLTVKNIAAEYRWNNHNYLVKYRNPEALSTDQDDPVPLEFGLGGSARFLERKLLAAVDVRKNTKQSFDFHAGAEYQVAPEFTVRSGFSAGRFTAGTGYMFDLKHYKLAVDYAFSTDRVGEGSEHIFSMDFLF